MPTSDEAPINLCATLPSARHPGPRKGPTMKKTALGVERLDKGLYLVRLKTRDPRTGKSKDVKRRVRARNPTEAARRREELRAEIELGLRTPAKERLADAAESWLRMKMPTLKASTRRNYADALDLHILPTLGDYYVDAIQKDDVVRWRDRFARTPLRTDANGEKLYPSPTTVNNALRVLKTLMADLTDDRGLRNPAARVRSLPVKHRSSSKGLSAEELRVLLRTLERHEERWYPIALLLSLTGARWGEASALEWRHIDEARMVIVIEQAHVRGRVDRTKTGNTREVPLAPELLRVLRTHRQRLVREQNPGLTRGWVFPSRKGTLMQPSSLRKPLHRSCLKAGVKQISPHGLRYTFNHLARQVAVGDVVRSMTGHVTEQMTLHYDWVEDHEKRDAHAALVTLVARGGTFGGTSKDDG